MIPRGLSLTSRAVRRVNQALVLHALRHWGPCSRARLARLTGLSAPAVSNIVDELLREGLIVEAGPGASSGGRPPVLLRFNAAAACLLGVEVGDGSVVGVLADLEGRPLARAAQPLGRRGEAWRAIVALVRQLTAAAGDGPPLRAVGVAVPGIVDPRSGEVVFSNRLGLRDEPLTARLVDALGLPVTVENDVNAMLLAEARWGAARGARHAVLLHVGDGIGAALLLDGRLYAGYRGGAGEVGYLVVDASSAHPLRAERGSFEFRYAVPAILARAGAATPEELCQRAAAEDPRAAGVLADAERALAAGIANLAAVLAPELVICHGPLFAAGGERLLAGLRRHLAGLVPRPPELVAARLGSDAAVQGALVRALEAVGLVEDPAWAAAALEGPGA